MAPIQQGLELDTSRDGPSSWCWFLLSPLSGSAGEDECRSDCFFCESSWERRGEPRKATGAPRVCAVSRCLLGYSGSPLGLGGEGAAGPSRAGGPSCEAGGPRVQLLPQLGGFPGFLLTSFPPLQVVQRIKAVETETRLLVVDKETDEYLCSLRLTCTEEMVHSGVLLGSGVSPTKSVGSDNGETPKPHLAGKELCPRLCHLKKGPNGYGFNLHSEKSRPGQFIRSVDPDSPASRAGLRPQDRLVEVNGINVEGLRHSEVVSHIKARESEARLLVVDPETDDYFKKLGVTPTEEHTKGETRTRGESGVRCSEAVEEEPVRALAAGTSTKEPLFPAAGTWPGDPFEESGLSLSPTAAEAKEKVRAKRVKKRAPQMDWNKKREIFSNF
uniref:PDZ domain-containing protein n=1 Tax=Anas zonorhyncha TaxID=75864 RepID=A0A8B9V7J5_9AVES